jgi:hypothetical protein
LKGGFGEPSGIRTQDHLIKSYKYEKLANENRALGALPPSIYFYILSFINISQRYVPDEISNIFVVEDHKY